MNKNKSLLAFVIFFIVVISIWCFGLFQGAVLSFSVSLIIAFFLYELSKWLTLRKYSTRIDNIYIISNHPATGDELKVPEGLERFCVSVTHQHVIKEVRKQELLLRTAKNPFFIGNITGKQKLCVVPIIFQSGEYVTEGWKDYKKRVIFQVKSELSDKHAYLKAKKESWYHTNADNQVST